MLTSNAVWWCLLVPHVVWKRGEGVWVVSQMVSYWKTLKWKIPHIFQSEYQNRLYKLPKNNSVITLFGTFGSVIENYFPLSSLTTWSILNPTWRGNLLRMVPSVLVWHQQKHFFPLKDWAKMKSESSIIYVTMEKKHSGQAPTLGL